MKKIFALIFSLILAVTIAVGVTLWVGAEDMPDAMTGILADETLATYNVGTYSISDDGYLGVPVDFTYFYDTKGFGASKPGNGETTMVMYVVNTCTPRVGTDSDVAIITSLVEKGYIVAVTDYHNHKTTTPDDIEWSLSTVVQSLKTGEYFGNSALTVGDYPETLIAPAGYTVSRDHIFWELDKHSVNGTLDQIVNVWNADFRQYKKDYVIPWVYQDGTRKPTQAAFDGSSPVWYSVGTGEGAVVWDGVSYVPDPEGGTYIKVKHTHATKISDCVKPDGTPIELDLAMHLVYPTNPENKVPVMVLANSGGNAASCATMAGRPHLWGFAFEGYAVAVYDYAYVPMVRDDHYGYFDGASGDKSVTGDNMTYSLFTYNHGYTPTAAMRYVRYLALSEPDTFAFNGDIGVMGNSKGSTITQLANYDLRHVKSVANGYTEQELLDYAQAYISSYNIGGYVLAGHHSETRYEAGKVTYTDEGMTVDGGERQPWLTYNGTMISSGAQFVYSSCGANIYILGEKFAPVYTCGHIDDETNGYEVNNQYINAARYHDIPLVWFEVSLGHVFVGRENKDHDVDPYVALKNYANYVLKKEAPRVLYTTPLANSEISATPTLTVKFAAIVAESEAAKIHLLGPDGEKIYGTLRSAYGQTEWTFVPETALVPGAKYTLVVPADLMGENGRTMASAYTAVFYTEKGALADTSVSADGLLSLTVPSVADYLAVDANRTELRILVENDAHNIIDAYLLSSPDAPMGAAAASVNIAEAGYYTLDLTDALAGYAAGSVVYVKLQSRYADSHDTVMVEDFEDGKHTFTNVGIAPNSVVDKDGDKALELHLAYRTGGAGHAYYAPNVVLNMDDYILSSVCAEDYGRYFTVTFDIKDTVSRDILVRCTSRSSAATGVIDYDVTNVNFKTSSTAGWVTCSFDVAINDAKYGKTALGEKGFKIVLIPSGDTNAKIYFDNFTLTEHRYTAQISYVALATVNAGGGAYKAPTTDTPFLVDGIGYATLTKAATAAGKNGTVVLASNITLTDATVLRVGDITLDLNGYAIRTNIEKASLISLIESASITLKNGSVYLSGGSLVGFENAVGSISVTVTLRDVYVGAEPCAMVSDVLLNTASAATVRLNLLLDGCSVDFRYESYAKNPLTLLPASTDTVTVSATVKGGSLWMSRQHKVTLAEDFSSMVFAKDSDGNYPVIYYTAARTLGADTIVYAEEGTVRYFLPTDASNRAGYTVYETQTNVLCTPFGMIPEAYADKDAYPFVVFNLADRSFVGAESILASDADGALQLLYHKTSGSYGIYMRRDFTHTDKLWNFRFIGCEAIVDLGGNTLTNASSAAAMFVAAANRAYRTDVTFRNGTICSAVNKPILQFRGGDATQKYEILFDNITFNTKSGVGITTWVTGASNSSATAHTADVTVRNCTFDTEGQSATTLFAIGDGSATFQNNVTVIGSDLKGDLAGVTVFTVADGSESVCSFALEANDAGEYLTNTRPTTSVRPDVTFTIGTRLMTFCRSIASEGNYTTYALDVDPMTTPFGVIPSEYSDTEKYPFVVFNVTKNTFVCATDMFAADASGALASILHKTGDTFGIYLRRDYTHTTTFWNFAHIATEVVIDLGGHTLTNVTGGAAMLLAQPKSDYAGNHVTFRNGTICSGADKPLVQFRPASKTQSFRITFERITFTVKQGVSLTNWIVGPYNGTSSLTYEGSVAVRDCVLDMGNVTSAVTLFCLGDGGSAASHGATLIGSTVLGDPSGLTLCSVVNGSQNCSFTFAKGTDGNYLTNTRPTASAMPTFAYTVDGKDMCFCRAISQDGEYTVYALDVDPLATPYGRIPEEYADVKKYPIIVFNLENGEVLLATTVLSGSAADTAIGYCIAGGGRYAIYVRANVQSVTSNWSIGSFAGEVILDLGGHTVTVKNTTFLEFQGRDNINTTVKLCNGTVRLADANAKLIGIGGKWGSGTKTNTVTVENVTFENLLGNLVFETFGDAVITTSTILFKNCRFEIPINAAVPIVLGTHGNNTRVAVTFEGGEFVFAGTNCDVFTNGTSSYKTVCFAQNASGEYACFTMPKDGIVASDYVTPDGNTLRFAKIGEEDGAVRYVLKEIKAEITDVNVNLGASLAMKYHVTLAEGGNIGDYKLVVTMNGKIVTVTESVLENGKYVFTFSGIAPQCMTDTIKAELVLGDEVVSVKDNYSVAQYAAEVLALYPDDAKLGVLLADMLYYGATAQLYKSYNADNLATSYLPENVSMSDVYPSKDANMPVMSESTSDAVFFKAAGVWFDNVNKIYVKFTADAEANVTVKANNKELAVESLGGDQYIVYTDGIYATDLDEMVTFELVVDGATVQTLQYSVNCYCARKASLESAMGRLAIALYVYGVSAEAYAN